MSSGFKGRAAGRFFTSTNNVLEKPLNPDSSANANSYSVIVDDEKYDYACQQLLRIDGSAADVIAYCITEIEKSLYDRFVVPSANPKIFAALKSLKDKMPEFQEVTNQLVKNMMSFANEINGRDQ